MQHWINCVEYVIVVFLFLDIFLFSMVFKIKYLMTIIGYVEVHGTIQFDNNQRGIRKKHKEMKPDLKLLYISRG